MVSLRSFVIHVCVFVCSSFCLLYTIFGCQSLDSLSVFHISAFMRVWLWVHLYTCLTNLSVCMYVSRTPCLFLFQPTFFCFCLHFYLSVCKCLSISLYVSLYVCLYVCLCHACFFSSFCLSLRMYLLYVASLCQSDVIRLDCMSVFVSVCMFADITQIHNIDVHKKQISKTNPWKFPRIDWIRTALHRQLLLWSAQTLQTFSAVCVLFCQTSRRRNVVVLRKFLLQLFSCTNFLQ